MSKLVHKDAKSVTFTITVDYDPDATDPDSLGDALDALIKTALSTPGILDDYGDPEVGATQLSHLGDNDFYGQLVQAATDDEATFIEAAAERAGLVWRCGCGWLNRDYEEECQAVDDQIRSTGRRCQGRRPE